VILLALFILNTASAQEMGTGLVNTSGDYTSTLGAGAVTNRQTASQLYQMAMQHASQAKATMNVALGVQAYQEYQNAIHSDDQAHNLAQSALHGVESGTNAGLFNISSFTSLGTSDLNDLVTTSSPYYAQARAQAQSYGLQMSEDRQYMKTPFGAFPTNMSQDEMLAIGSQIAARYGIPASVIAAGLAAGQTSSQAVAQKLAADIQQKLAAGGAASATAAIAKIDAAAPNPATDNAAAAAAGDRQPASIGAAKAASAPDYDMSGHAQQLDEYRSKLLQEMGLESIGSKDENIFEMVHERYVSVQGQDRLIALP